MLKTVLKRLAEDSGFWRSTLTYIIQMKTFIAKANWSSGYKRNVVTAYNHYSVFHKISWKKPKYHRAYSIKKLPLESDIDLIISYTRTRNRVAFKRVLELKSETLALLKQLVSTKNLSINEKIFPCSKTLQKNWNRMRNRIAERLCKPELKQIRLYDLRHFYGTMLYHKTKDIIHVQRKMGHRNLKNTLIYID